jgi:hypothetical protein
MLFTVEIWLIIVVVVLIIFNIWVLHILADAHATLMAILQHNLSKIYQKLK